MSDATQRVLARLSASGFETRLGSAEPFGEALPLVRGTASDARTAQVAYVAEHHADDDLDAWRQLLFAGSGLRHQLAGDGPAGFGTPVVLAVVDAEGERRLRALTEDLAQRYALFNRVDLNLVRQRDLQDPDALDLALAPLLPRCREMLGQEISKQEVQRFWSVLRDEIARTAAELPVELAPFADEAAHDSADALIGDSAEALELPTPTPLASIELQNFRSFAHATIEFAPVSVVHGPNGSGKSSVLEALELVWAGQSQRQPDDVEAEEYARHLPRDGSGAFLIRAGDREVTAIAASPLAELPRSVLTQDAVAGLVGSSPGDRYTGLLAVSGLEVPDLKKRTAKLVADAKREADAALVRAGLPPLPRSDSVALRHLGRAMSTALAAQLPSDADLEGLERTLTELSGGAFVPRSRRLEKVARALARTDALTGHATSPLGDHALIDAVRAAQEAVRNLAEERQQAARAARVLLDALAAYSAPAHAVETDRREASGIPPELAVRWLSHARGLVEAAQRFRVDAESIDDPDWARAITGYAAAVEAAAQAVPRQRLERLARAAAASAPPRIAPAPDPAIYDAAGFARAPDDVRRIMAPLRALADELQRHVEALHGLSRELEQHPARSFARDRELVLRALCRFEVARLLRREGPVMRASEELVRELLQGRLAPVLRELVAAIVRFEWYFKPLQLQVPVSTNEVVLGGLATSQPDLDARLVLNAAERNVVGLAWFLALHLLQPEARRRVLVLDDPTAALDAVNQAGFISTLRAFVRLIRPDQVVVATHDDALAAVLAEELAPVDGWPSSTLRVRCRRDPDDGSRATVEWTASASRATDDEAVALGLRGESTLFS